ncbi:MAG: hypothetical protein JSS68_14275 [Actinobacteria bacterium]|nr:hypothetical protein [Actinomycetota bacterium]MBS1883723.1 hypothetical protein [Actinomycetota bacterium]
MNMRRITKLLSLVLLAAAVAIPASIAGATGELPKVPAASFSTPTEFLIKPAKLSLGTSACAPYFSNLRWTSYGRNVARAEGTGLFPVKGASDCAEAANVARPEPARIVLSSAHYCEGRLIFMRIGWQGRGVHAHTVTYACR